MAMFKPRSEPGESSGSLESRRESPDLKVDPALSKPRTGGGGATVGQSVRIQGDISGEEDLTVQGIVEGSISLKNHLVTIGKEGRVNATVDARIIRIDGTVDGDLHGHEQIVVGTSGNVRGNISAPRVTLEDGCRFKGSIDMDGAETRTPATAPAASASGRSEKPDPGKMGPGKAL